MGGSSSKENEQELLPKGYVFPQDRQDIRGNPRSGPETDPEEAEYDPTADKYDYLIVFKNPVGNIEDEKVEKQTDSGGGFSAFGGGGDDERFSWEQVEEIWFQAIPGEEEKKNLGVAAIKEAWKQRFRVDNVEPDDTVPASAFYGLVREHIVEALSRRTGLQLKLSPSQDGQLVYCQIRAPMALLESKADVMDYKLKFRPEVDPGLEFWERISPDSDRSDPTYVELEEEAKLYTRDHANEILEGLFLAKKINPGDMAVFDEDEPTPKHWSRRVHTLERIADKAKLGPITNRYPAYASFDSAPKERHLYEEYFSVRGKTLFQSKDRLFLTKRIFDEVFDFGVLRDRECIESIMALHDANFGEAICREWFQRRWVEFWRGESDRIGAPYVSHPAIERGIKCPWSLRPWAQPLMEIRSYYGEKVALYFAWLGFYGSALFVPAMVAGANYLYISLEGISPEIQGFHPTLYVMAIFLVIWSALYKEEWDRESQVCALKWGTFGFEDFESDRPQFQGYDLQPRRVSPITNQNETWFPPEVRAKRQRGSMMVVFGFIIGLLACVSFIFYAEYYLETEQGYWWGSSVCSLANAVLIQTMSTIYSKVSSQLNDYENYRTDTAFEDNMIFKKFLFEMFNNYAAVAYTAFLKGSISICSDGTNNCLGDMKELLISIFATRFAMMGYSIFKKSIEGATESAAPKETAVAENMNDDEAGGGGDELKEAARFEAEVKLEEYEGTFDDYAEIVLQMGYVTMFTCGWYLVPSLAMIEVLIQIRVDAYAMVSLNQRPDPCPAEGVGMWGSLMEAMGLLAVYTNTGIICFTTKSVDYYGFDNKLLYFFILEQAVLFIKLIVHNSVDDVPEWVDETRKRQEFIVNKHKNVIFYDEGGDDDDAVADEQARRGHVDADALNITKATAGARALPEKDVIRLEWLKYKLRENQQNVKIARDQFKVACASEVFREETGVSESRKSPGLALGMVNLSVLTIEGLSSKADPIDPSKCRIVVQVRDNSKRGGYEGSPGPGPQVSKNGRRPAGAGPKDFTRFEFNQQFSLAPIKTAYAELVIEVMDESTKKKRGTAKVSLQDLLSQVPQNKTLGMQRKGKDGKDVTGGTAIMYIRAQFQYSKVRPLKTRIYELLEEQRKLQRDVTNMQLRKDLDYEWDFPERNDDE